MHLGKPKKMPVTGCSPRNKRSRLHATTLVEHTRLYLGLWLAAGDWNMRTSQVLQWMVQEKADVHVQAQEGATCVVPILFEVSRQHTNHPTLTSEYSPRGREYLDLTWRCDTKDRRDTTRDTSVYHPIIILVCLSTAII